MKLYKKGQITSIGKTYIILETNFSGEIIYVSNASNFKKNEQTKVYIYEYQYENTKSVYGFATFKERIMFEDLLSIPGIGPKTSITILGTNINLIIKLISQGDIENLSEIPGIGAKSARQIIFDLQSKYKKINSKIKTHTKPQQRIYQPHEIVNTLKTLGFNSNQIKFVIKKIEPSENIEYMVENAIRMLTDANKQKATA